MREIDTKPTNIEPWDEFPSLEKWKKMHAEELKGYTDEEIQNAYEDDRDAYYHLSEWL